MAARDMANVVPSEPEKGRTSVHSDEKRPSNVAWEGHGGDPLPSPSATRQQPPTKGGTTQKIRLYVQQSVASMLRSFVRGRFAQGVMLIALLLALFMPDVWKIAGMNNNTGIDVVLSLVMLLFACELCTLCLVEASYILSFFNFMDFIGTISMLFDISYMYGDDHTKPVMSTGDDSGASLLILRAARTAKLGARMGRLSRVVRVLRYLPFLTGQHSSSSSTPSEEKGIASVISGQLSHLLATRVACLSIVLVMVIPIFEMWTFPEVDYSLNTWVDRFSVNLKENRLTEMSAELSMMVDFYRLRSYGPYLACEGKYNAKDDTFLCNTYFSGWTPVMGAPSRMGSARLVHSNTVMVGFNMYFPDALEAGMSLSTFFFIVSIMVFSGLSFSSVVQELTVRPLERMLSAVRLIATTVFKFTAEVAQDDEEMTDIDSSSEMKLLEKVVQKLAVIVDLQTRKEVQTTDDMRDEDIGILSMMQGRSIQEDAAKRNVRSSSFQGNRSRAPATAMMRLEEFGMTQELYNSMAFNTLGCTKAQRSSLVAYTILRFFEAGQGFLRGHDDEATLARFITATEKEYLPNPFHNYAHAVDVTHGTARIMRITHSHLFFTELEQFSLLIAAVSHDLGHPGVNNGFLCEVGHDLALQYNDKSPLENMHCAKLYTIVGNPGTNVFTSLSKEQYKEARKCCIETILHTDMMVHQAMVKDLQMICEMNAEVFAAMPLSGQNDYQPTVVESEVFSQPENKQTLMAMVLHSADVSNPCRSWEVTQAWAMVCLEEFFAQGDQEKMQGIPVQFLNDRDKLNRPNSQIGFIEFMIAPFFVVQIRLFPGLHEYGANLANNLETWEDMWAAEIQPGEDERNKVRKRVGKVRENLENAKERIVPP
eukprot:TRINITY_DN26990_c0_g2_i1.p1 TRINITY_DN26990_c0_g2~~TRINITY_DN26990_c0_g2_i1.p1  ORF type:complete len:878 (+),score=186.71 TRINITY_DN26990_c0_g2_i1:175-2808(+)